MIDLIQNEMVFQDIHFFLLDVQMNMLEMLEGTTPSQADTSLMP